MSTNIVHYLSDVQCTHYRCLCVRVPSDVNGCGFMCTCEYIEHLCVYTQGHYVYASMFVYVCMYGCIWCVYIYISLKLYVLAASFHNCVNSQQECTDDQV